MKVKDIINKWTRIEKGQYVTISEYMGISSPNKQVKSHPFPIYKDWEFDVDDDELKRLMNMTAGSFSFNENGLTVYGEDKNKCYY